MIFLQTSHLISSFPLFKHWHLVLLSLTPDTLPISSIFSAAHTVLHIWGFFFFRYPSGKLYFLFCHFMVILPLFFVFCTHIKFKEEIAQLSTSSFSFYKIHNFKLKPYVGHFKSFYFSQRVWWNFNCFFWYWLNITWGVSAWRISHLWHSLIVMKRHFFGGGRGVQAV